MAKLIKLYSIDGIMIVKSGLHIGAKESGSKIGGCDNPVIRNPLNGQPYIPGSSVKGKMRISLEELLDKGSHGNPCGCGNHDCIICQLFGAHMNQSSRAGKPRLSIVDMDLNEDFVDDLTASGKSLADIIEIKAATMIDRINGTAAKNSLRNEERIAPGTKFNVRLLVKIYEGDNEEQIFDNIKLGIRLIEEQGLGSKTSSGSGRVEFDIDWSHMINVIA